MIVDFAAIGLRWKARIAVTPYRPGTLYEPPEPAETEIIDLWTPRGDDAGWVLESDDVREQIEAALREHLARGDWVDDDEP